MAARSKGGRASRPKRTPAARILVVTEGKLTEPQYVDRLDGFLRSKGATAIVKSVGAGQDPVKVVKKCIEHRDRAEGTDKAYDHCVCLVDVDRHAALQSACALADREGVRLLVSNLKFEVWLRWHAEERRSSLSSAQLDEITETLGLLKNKALSPRFPIEGVDRACEIARMADAKLAAGRVGPDPSSALPLLVDLMRGR